MSATFSCFSITDLSHLMRVQLHLGCPSTLYGASLWSLFIQLFPAILLSPRIDVHLSRVRNKEFSAFFSWLPTKFLVALSAKFLCLFYFLSMTLLQFSDKPIVQEHQVFYLSSSQFNFHFST